jgi:hypothetical protein
VTNLRVLLDDCNVEAALGDLSGQKASGRPRTDYQDIRVHHQTNIGARN